MTSSLNIHRHAEANSQGTLLWIGQRISEEFHEAFQHCQGSASQVAVRHDIDDALVRPASAVEAIIVTRQSTHQHCESQLHQLAEAYPGTIIIQMLGSLCAGERPRSNVVFDEKTIYWHQWNQHLPGWLTGCGVSSMVESHAVSSIVIVANQLSSAEPLMDLASSSGMPTLWCKRPSGHLIRNASAVWWDDSAARPTTARNWQHRISEIESANQQVGQPRRCRHVWLACWPRRQQIRAAVDGGVDLVISKPHEISLLSETITQSKPKVDTATTNGQVIRQTHKTRAA